MNLLHLKYAVEIEKTGSISKAAENLYMGQPHLSKAIRDLEESLGITIFDRTSKGVIPTKEGREFLNHTKSILKQIEEMENLYRKDDNKKVKFVISAPKDENYASVFTSYIKSVAESCEVSFQYQESTAVQSINQVSEGLNNFAVIRYQKKYEDYFLSFLNEENLMHKKIRQIPLFVMTNKQSELADKEKVTSDDLIKFTEIVTEIVDIPLLPLAKLREIANNNAKRRIIVVDDRSAQKELLEQIPKSYCLVSYNKQLSLSFFLLPYEDSENIYQEVLIYQKNYQFSKHDHNFINLLISAFK